MKREKARRFLDYAVRQVRENFVYNLHSRAQLPHTRGGAFSTRFSPFINERNVEGIWPELERASTDIATMAMPSSSCLTSRYASPSLSGNKT